MPEGPEIWRTADRLSQALKDRQVQKVFFAFDELKNYEEVLRDERITEIRPRGKALLTRFGNGLNIYSHNQLYGKWYVSERGEVPDTNRSLRIALHNGDYSAFLYSASEIEVLEDKELADHPFLQNLGPDVVDPEVTVEEVEERFCSKTFRNRKLTTLLLDQHFLSGLGNYLRSEILFKAGVHPSLRPKDCSGKQLAALAEASVELARRSYRTKGITNDPEIVEAMKREGTAWRDYRFYVFNREGQRCNICGSEIIKDRMGGRRLYYCPQCQSKE